MDLYDIFLVEAKGERSGLYYYYVPTFLRFFVIFFKRDVWGDKVCFLNCSFWTLSLYCLILKLPLNSFGVNVKFFIYFMFLFTIFSYFLFFRYLFFFIRVGDSDIDDSLMINYSFFEFWDELSGFVIFNLLFYVKNLGFFE